MNAGSGCPEAQSCDYFYSSEVIFEIVSEIEFWLYSHLANVCIVLTVSSLKVDIKSKPENIS